MGYAKLLDEARDYYRLCDEAAALGVPVSLDDPETPQTVQELREAVLTARDRWNRSNA